MSAPWRILQVGPTLHPNLGFRRGRQGRPHLTGPREPDPGEDSILMTI